MRAIAQNSVTLKWAYVEHTDHEGNNLIVIGDAHFDTREGAIEHSQYYADDSYVKEDKNVVRLKNIEKELKYLQQFQDKINQLNAEKDELEKLVN